MLISLSLAFTTGDDYDTFNLNPEDDIYSLEGNYDREKCKTCCKVMFYNEKIDRVMDMEFDDKHKVRLSTKNFEQSILMRPLNISKTTHFFELAAYKQINVYVIPRRVMDVRQGSVLGNPLIIWLRKPPLEPKTENQRFTYNYPYTFKGSNLTSYPKHLVIYNGYCLGVSSTYKKWAGNQDLETDGIQISAQKCSDTKNQEFVLIYA